MNADQRRSIHTGKRTKVLFVLSAILGITFVLFVSDYGQELLRRNYLKPGMSHFKVDDVWMGVGLAPWIYLLAPALAFAMAALISLVFDRRSGSVN